MPVALAIAGSAIVGAGASMYSASKAAKAQQSAASQATAVQQHMYDQTRSDLAPYRDAGANAIPQLNNLLTGDPAKAQAQMSQLPGYQFALTQGLQATQNSAAARGLGTSGAALRGAADYSTGLANATYGDQVNRLMGYAGMGANAAAQTGQFGVQTGQSIGQNITGAGNAQAAGYMAGGNAVGNAAGNIGQMYLMNSLMQNNGGAGLFGSNPDHVLRDYFGG